MTDSGQIWILGATGRVGRGVAQRLVTQGLTPTLVGRDRARLAQLGLDVPMVVADGVESIAAEITRQRPSVVLNTIGDYATTAATIARAGMPGGHYLDLAADLASIPRLLALHEEAAAAGSTVLTGVGFGVLATEAVVAALCAGRPTPREVRVDALASVAMEAGTVGTALAASIVDGLTMGGRRYENGRLAATRIGSDVRQITLPDGETVTALGVPAGELAAAHAASGAPFVTAASSFVMVPPAVRALLPVVRALLSIPALRRYAIARFARTPFKAAPRPRRHSWGHAIVEWPDGTRREGWLRADEGMDYTVDVVAEVAARLARGEGKPGAYTPAAAFGPDLATVGGAALILDPS
jgi:short subunit dehydrogenase-like uncharacterized protein